jgi:isoamylase
VLARRLSGSADIYDNRGRRTWASINFITAHDGFTLHDLVSYAGKHNQANGESNPDGTHENHSFNCGAEGETDDASVRVLRRRQIRNLLTTLLCSQGVPMLLAGDEFGRTQQGNNNAYCQDNEISWLDWEIGEDGYRLLTFTRALIRLRREHIVFHRDRFFHGRVIAGTQVKDVVWLRPDGAEMAEEDWHDGEARALAMLLSGEAGLTHLTARGAQEPDETFMVLFNASSVAMDFQLSMPPVGRRWEVLLDTAAEDAPKDGQRRRPDGRVSMIAQSMMVLIASPDEGAG